MSDLVIVGGLVVNRDSSRRAHVVVDGGVVTEVVDADQPVPVADEVLDATGRVVMPGGVDGHCHIAQVTGRYRTLDDFATTSIAALWGGTTTILDFGIPRDATESPLDAARRKAELAEQSRCDVGLHGSVIEWDDTVPAQLEALAAMGIRSVKVYMTNRGTTMADGDTVLRVLKEMRRLDGVTYVHAEHDALVVDCTRTHAEAGLIGVAHLHRTRPELAEEASVREVLAMSEYTRSPVYFVHQSTPVAVDLVQEARARGLQVWSETCPHYLLLDEDCYAGPVPEWFACCPPIRSAATARALRERFLAGAIDTVSSDHSCYDLTQKRQHTDDVRFMPHGLPGVETRMPAALTTLLEQAGAAGRVPSTDLLQRFVDLFSAAPARLNGLPSKGAVEVGRDADLVVLDPTEARTLDGSRLHMGTDFSPFDGRELYGWPQQVVAGGRVVLDDQGFHDPGPVGRLLRRSGFHEGLQAWDAGPVATNRSLVDAEAR
jgi:dihydropyrimidinase